MTDTTQLNFEFVRLCLQDGIWTIELIVKDYFKKFQNKYVIKMEYSLEKFYSRLMEAERQREKADREQLVSDTDYDEVIKQIEKEIVLAKQSHSDIIFEFFLMECKYKGNKTFFKGMIGEDVIGIFNKERESLENYLIKFMDKPGDNQ